MTQPEQFSPADLDRLANEVLTLVELAEARTLGWGFVRVQRDLAADLPALLGQLPTLGRELWERAARAGIGPSDILENLAERRLILEAGGRHKSRFAEAVRLLLLLRQRFSFEDWQDAPRLVSDLRLQLRRRRYPRRDTPAAELLADLDRLPAGDLERAAASALLAGSGGTPIKLARFQREATTRLLRDLRGPEDSGLVISAGTGAGKTKAFYIPALAHIAAQISDAPWTKALAIYPRIELLKDQLAEAFGEARKLDGLLRGRGLRPVSIGSYYGDTPTSAEWLLKSGPQRGWGWDETRARDGWIFPSMHCPDPDCQGDLVWHRQDVEAEAKENRAGRYGRFARLQCGSCGYVLDSGKLLLTREQMVRNPPDLLFTTTEMLNRRLSRADEHSLFGVRTERPPRLMLLDEVHTYDGLTGAQVAHLLRRWRHARGDHAGQSLAIVGLSATLTQAESFFARLTGLPLGWVRAVAPREEDLIDEGIEYNLVLKGDPVSGTSLLSTSVQTNMLLARILDTPHRPDGPISRGTYGQKVFAFTDTLDVINRWFHIEHDAESVQQLSQWRGRPPRAGREELRLINDAGQYWWVCEQIGHDLEAGLALGLTSSQYRGVDRAADLVVATSALEVGFNDPDVGAVVQHKAPRSLASFLQRKGRAGRTRAMRPWMVVVTSAYGRDRWAFQHAERLFSPTLPPIELPLDNSYVRAIQAAYALMDWLALRLARAGDLVDVWRALASSDKGQGRLAGQRRAIADLLAEVLEGGPALDDLREHLRAALGLGDDDLALNLILWGEPRPLLMEVIPTALRQLETGWQRIVGGAPQPWSDGISREPLPDFVPPNLFSLLSLPELALHIPESRAAGAPMRDDEHMALVQGMVEFAPGHVSKRFARREQTREAHWLGLPSDDRLAGGIIQLRDLAVELDPAPRPVTLDGLDVLVYRPRAYTLTITPLSVRPTSSAWLLWRSRFEPQRRGAAGGTEDDVPATTLALAPDSSWRALLGKICAFTQTGGSWVEVLRIAGGVRAETRYEDGTERRRRLFFADGEVSAALGFSMCVDALRFQIRPLDVPRLLDGPDWPDLRQHLVPSYMLHRIETHPLLQAQELSDFEHGWLWQLELSMLVAVAVARGVDLPTAAAEVRGSRTALAQRTMDVIFQTQRFEESEDEIDRTGRLRQRLLDLVGDPQVAGALDECAEVLWSPPDAPLADWLQSCYAASLGAALLDAVARLVPDINQDDLVLDVEGGTVWISEQTPGGIGIVARIAEAIARRPRALDLQLADTLRHCEREQLAWQLAAVAELVGQGEPQLAGAFTAVRAASDLDSQTAALRELSAALEQSGLPATRDLTVALGAKLLRPSSDTDSDALVAVLAQRWRNEQRRLGCAIDLRVMAVAARRIDAVEQLVQRVLARVGGGAAPSESQIFNLLQSLLWLDCRDSCPDCIDRPQPYQRLARPSRALLRALVEPSGEPVVYGAEGWEALAGDRLAERYACQIVCAQDQIAALRERITQMLTTPVEIEFQQHYPALERVERDRGRWLFGLVIRELAQR